MSVLEIHFHTQMWRGGGSVGIFEHPVLLPLLALRSPDLIMLHSHVSFTTAVLWRRRCLSKFKGFFYFDDSVSLLFYLSVQPRTAAFYFFRAAFFISWDLSCVRHFINHFFLPLPLPACLPACTYAPIAGWNGCSNGFSAAFSFLLFPMYFFTFSLPPPPAVFFFPLFSIVKWIGPWGKFSPEERAKKQKGRGQERESNPFFLGCFIPDSRSVLFPPAGSGQVTNQTHRMEKYS